MTWPRLSRSLALHKHQALHVSSAHLPSSSLQVPYSLHGPEHLEGRAAICKQDRASQSRPVPMVSCLNHDVQFPPACWLHFWGPKTSRSSILRLGKHTPWACCSFVETCIRMHSRTHLPVQVLLDHQKPLCVQRVQQSRNELELEIEKASCQIHLK